MAERRNLPIAVDGGEMGSTVVLPEPGSGPGVVLLQEIFGVNDFVLGKAEELAALGYVVLCPDVFWRIEQGVALHHDEEALGRGFSLVSRYGELPDAERVGDLLAALAATRGLPEVSGPVGVLGYCLGGTLAYLVAAKGDPDACVSYYGSGVPDLLGLAQAITCPTLFVFGGRDSYLPRQRAYEVVQAFTGRPGFEFHVEEEAGHAFENLLAPAFADPEAAARSWPVTSRFLAAHLRP